MTDHTFPSADHPEDRPGPHGDNIRIILSHATSYLGSHERGRAALRQLLALLDGPAAGFDHEAWMHFSNLLSAYRFGYPGTVIELIRDQVD